MSATATTELHLLHVEDNELDAMALRRAFGKLEISLPLARAKNGVEALEKLQQNAGEQHQGAQTVILLDINMPRMNGHEFLKELRGDPTLRHTPVFVLTTSDRPSDIRKAYDKNVAGYIVKPVSSGKFLERIKHWADFLSVIEPPAAV
ncbi:response regulator [Roseovarius aestuarii]|uniref:Response regulator rcp1 n=1 Tax=Roseovarius aestuarii TaxID=475083 RepID=A0A1X7BRD1_9RHOB|nr:response regulator [Roseovarius aestuarii]SMC12143.1 Response regulator rcp1 [Roseovarius aestuarii]